MNRKKAEKIFERILINNIKKKICGDLLELKNYGGVFLSETKEDVSEKIKQIFGVKNFYPVQILNSLEEDNNFLSHLSFKNNFRGLKVYFLHFHSYPQTKKGSIEKVKKL